MREPALALLALALVGCPRAPIPEHLRPAPVEAEAAPSPTSREDALATLLDGDPLARARVGIDPSAVAPFDEALAAWLEEVATWPREEAAARLQAAEPEWRGTPMLALSRGRRLAEAEVLLAPREGPDAVAAQAVLARLTPLRATDELPTSLDRDPLAGFSDPGTARERALGVADGWVLAAWLDGRDVPLAPVSVALDRPMHDRLRETRLGVLIRARAAAADGSPEAGWAALQRATALALERAAADRDSEQKAWTAHRAAAAEELGEDKPIRALLAQAREGLTAAAGDDRAAGGAVLAIHAARWAGDCGGVPCRSLDRTDGLGAPDRWHPDAGRLARIWRVIALKEALDGADVALDRPSWPEALVDLVDALLGTGAGPFEVTVVQRSRSGPATWLALGRGLGLETVDQEEVRDALGAHLESVVDEALSDAPEPEVRALLERIRRRAR